jgi:tetratricopeptide (TPR) repeat protein
MGSRYFRISLFNLLIIVLLFSSCRETKKNDDKAQKTDSLTIALSEITQKIAGDISNPDLYHHRSELYLQDHQFDGSLKDINKAISLSGKNPYYYITLSDIYLAMGKPDPCRESLLKALNLDPENKKALLKAAKLELIVKEYKQTFEYIKQALNVDKINPEAYFTRGVALLETGDTSSAILDFQTTISQDQQNYDAYMELGEIYSTRKDNLAVDYLKDALKIKPNNKEALYFLGMVYQENSQYDNAIQTYLTLQKTDSSFKNAPYNIGYIYLVYMKDFKQAEKYFTDAIKLDPAYAEAFYNRGLAYEYDGSYSNAYRDYKKTLELSVNYQKAIDGLNRIDKLKYKK